MLAPKAERIAEAAFHLEDIADELRTYLKNIQTDESRLDTVEERLDTLVKLKRKYGGSLETVLLRLESIDHEFSEVENLSGNIADTEKKLFELHSKLTELTHKLSRDRKKTAKTLAQKVEKELTSLKMPHTKFKISFRTMQADEDADPYLTIEEKTVFETGDRPSNLSGLLRMWENR